MVGIAVWNVKDIWGYYAWAICGRTLIRLRAPRTYSPYSPYSPPLTTTLSHSPKMAERTSLRGDKKIELQLSSHQPLFADQLRLLDERLSIVFGEPPSSRHAPHETKQTQEQIRQRHIHRQAHRTYNRILETIPHYFLVFILAKSPAGCARFNDSRFISDYKQKQPYPTQLNYTFKDQLIASAGQGVADCAKFREWLSLIFDGS